MLQRSATRTAKPAHHTSGESAGFSGAGPGRTGGVLKSAWPIDQQLIAKHTGHLHRLLHQSIAAVPTADRCLVPLRQGISDTTGQGAQRGLANKPMIKHQQIGAALQSHVTLESAIDRIQIGESGPPRTGGCAERHGDARQLQPVGKQLAGIENLATTCG